MRCNTGFIAARRGACGPHGLEWLEMRFGQTTLGDEEDFRGNKIERDGVLVGPRGATARFTHYNFARIHKTLRITPAMAAGLTDHVWSLEEIAGLAK